MCLCHGYVGGQGALGTWESASVFMGIFLPCVVLSQIPMKISLHMLGEFLEEYRNVFGHSGELMVNRSFSAAPGLHG